jgi:hypothetical protein
MKNMLSMQSTKTKDLGISRYDKINWRIQAEITVSLALAHKDSCQHRFFG